MIDWWQSAGTNGVEPARRRKRARPLRFETSHPSRRKTRQLEWLEPRALMAGDSLQWYAQGPGPALNGGTTGLTAQQNPVTGAVHTVIAHPTNPDILWIGGVNGGIWGTVNATSSSPTWVPQSDQASSLSIGAMDLDPLDATFKTLVAGIGRYSAAFQAGGKLTGALMTTDGGATWNAIGGATLDGRNISGIASRGGNMVVTANQQDYGQLGLFPTALGGVYRSTDGGASFQLISNGGASGLPAGDYSDLVGDPGNPNRLYTAALGIGAFRSDDAGATWQNITTGLTGFDATNNNVEFAVHNNTGAGTNAVYVGIVNHVDPLDLGFVSGFFRSENQGGTWVAMDVPPVHNGGQGALHFSIVADPTSPTIVYVGGDRSDAGTGNIVRGNSSLAAGAQFTAIVDAGAAGTAPHADSREMVFDAAGSLIDGDDGGIYKRPAPTTSSGAWSSIIGNLQITEFNGIAFDNNTHTALGGAHDNGTLYQTVIANTTWQSTEIGGDGGVVAVDDSQPGISIRYFTPQFLGIPYFPGFQRQTFASDGTLLSDERVNLAGLFDGVPFYAQYVLNAVDPVRMAVRSRTQVFVSSNRGDSVTSAGTIGNAGIPTFLSTTALAYGGRIGGQAFPDVLYASAGNNFFFRQNAGQALSLVSQVPGGTILDIALKPDDYRIVYVITSSGVFRSGDAGQTWGNLTGTLNDNLRTIAILNDGGIEELFVGGDLGVYRSFSTSYGQWAELGAGLPNAPVIDLEYDFDDDVLLAGTFGRGAWSLGELRKPRAGDDTATTLEDVPVDIPVLANDSGLSINPGTVEIVQGPANGTATVDPLSGVVHYLSAQDYNGSDSFTYRFRDTRGVLSNIASVSITIIPVNDPPVAVRDTGRTAVNTPVVIDVLANDYDIDSAINLDSVTQTSSPSQGSVVYNPVTRLFTYTPNLGFAGGDSFTYTIRDVEGLESNTGVVRIRVGDPVSVSGLVYIDNNKNGVRDPGEFGLRDVLVTLSKTDSTFTFTESLRSGADGTFLFAEAPGSDAIYPTGVYTVTEIHPTAFLDGTDVAGSPPPATITNDQFGGIFLAQNAAATSYTFSEYGLRAEFLASYLGLQIFLASGDPNAFDIYAVSPLQLTGTLAALEGLPQLAAFSLGSEPAGLPLLVDGQATSASVLLVGLPGSTTAVTAPAIQAYNGTAYLFDSWSDGAPSNRTVTAGAGAQTLTARYRPLQGSTTNYAYVLAAGSKLGITAISAEQLGQLVGQLAQGGSRGAVGAALWSTAENFGRLVERMYQTYLHRAADASGRQALVGRLETGAKENDLAAEILAGVEYALNGHLSPAQFVDGLYRDVLGRNADAAGRATWVAAIERGTSRLDVAKAFLNSEENLGRVVEQSYRDILGRGADAGGKALYVGLLKSGSLTTASMAARMLASDEFFNRATGSQLSAGETAFARALYSDLAGRTPTANELASWSISVSLGTSRQEMISQLWDTADSLGRRVDRLYQSILHRPADAVGRASNINLLLGGASEEDIARTLLTSTEYAQSHATNAAFVEGLYRDVLGRNSDAGGKAGWVRSLDTGRSRAEIAASFLSSDERYLKIIDGYYASYLGRAADAAGRSFYLGWLRQGLLTTTTAAEAMLASDEYFARSSRRRV